MKTARLFNTIYVIITAFIFLPFAALGWVAAEVFIAFKAGFVWSQIYNARASKDASKTIDELFGG